MRFEDKRRQLYERAVAGCEKRDVQCVSAVVKFPNNDAYDFIMEYQQFKSDSGSAVVVGR